MASAEENKTLANETAEELLTAIKAQAKQWTRPDQLKELAEAYATVKEAMPRAAGRARGA